MNNMEELRKVQIEMLQIFKDICSKHNLTWFCVCGTALGAVKYKGFIPWDDDLDVALPREDYEKFLNVAPQYLPEHIFLQNHKTDKRFPHPFSKLRNSNTTFIEYGVAHLDINHGIYIDIFPIDGYPKKERDIKKLRFKKKVLCNLFYCAVANKYYSKISIKTRILRFFGFHKITYRTLIRFNKVISKYRTEDSEIWCNHGNWQGDLEYAPRTQYGTGTVAIFEGIEVMIPEKYDAYLTQKYGDWRSDPPIEKQRTHHGVKKVDVEKPYTEYLNNN